ncbi:hypothetical protein [Lewinella sp. W8]|uniref:hypothetical protein n=1 Tax=Lewinella sp. W8 TaxID=2528208 RepID=UPI0012B5F97C|nr:hypothetical protein [Lewinella sp. W8]MTB49624.1 hypothetical protein [Lewinella sp. W8]
MSIGGQVPRICLVGILGVIVALMVGCSPARKVARHYGVSKRSLEKDLIVLDRSGREKTRRVKPYRVGRRVVSVLSKDTSLYALIAPMKKGKFYGPFLQGDSTVFYYRKMATTPKGYADITIAQIHQPFGMGNATFQRYLDTVKTRAFRERALLDEVLERYQPEERPHLGMVLNEELLDLTRLKPEVIKFLEEEAVFRVSQSPKTEMTHTTYLELLQKRSPVRTIEHHNFITVYVSKPIDR